MGTYASSRVESSTNILCYRAPAVVHHLASLVSRSRDVLCLPVLVPIACNHPVCTQLINQMNRLLHVARECFTWLWVYWSTNTNRTVFYRRGWSTHGCPANNNNNKMDEPGAWSSTRTRTDSARTHPSHHIGWDLSRTSGCVPVFLAFFQIY